MKQRKQIREALGRKSRQLGDMNMTRVFLTIAKEPLSFSELLEKTELSRPVLAKHLRHLEKNLAIYRDTIKPNQTLDAKKVGKIIYRVTLDEIPRILKQALSLLDILSDPFEDKELDEELEKHKRAIAKAIEKYINQYNKTREEGLKADLKNLGVRKVEG